MWSLHATEYYLAIKGNEGLRPAVTRIIFENTTRSVGSQSQEITCSLIPLMGNSRTHKCPQRQEAARWLQGLGGGRGQGPDVAPVMQRCGHQGTGVSVMTARGQVREVLETP